MNVFLRSLTLVVVLLGLGACSNTALDTGMDDITRTNRAAANQLIRIAGPALRPGDAIIAASFANIDDLTRSSTFGRVASAQLTSQLTAAGHKHCKCWQISSNTVYRNLANSKTRCGREKYGCTTRICRLR